MPSPAIVHEAFITIEGDAPIKPMVVVPTTDGGLFVAGRGGTAAWAAKTDTNGKVIWQYSTFAMNGNFYPEYRGAVPMPDGSTFLCGYKPSSPDTYAPGLVTHLDAQGRVINEQLIIH